MENISWSDHPLVSFDAYLETCKYSDKTRIAYKSIFNSLIVFLKNNGETLKTVNERIILLWLESLAVSDKTQMRYLSLLSSIQQEMFENHEIDENVASLVIDKKYQNKKKVKGKKAKRLPVALNEIEFDKFMAVVNKPDQLERRKIVALLLVGCGLREIELCNLGARDVHLDVENPYLRVIGKADKEREVPIPEEICPELERYEATLPDLDGPFVGVERDGKLMPYSPSGVYRMINGMMSEAKIVKQRLSPHVLRHTWATRQLQIGVHIATVSLWMGHDSIVTTAIYQHAIVARTSTVRPRF